MTHTRIRMPTECKNVFQMLSFQNIYAQRILFLSIGNWSTRFHLFMGEFLVENSRIFQTLDTTDLVSLLTFFLKPVRICLHHNMTSSYKHNLLWNLQRLQISLSFQNVIFFGSEAIAIWPEENKELEKPRWELIQCWIRLTEIG